MLAAFASTIVHTGPLGTGAAAKLCNQVMQYVAWAAAYDALQLAEAAGLAPEALETITAATGVTGESTRRFFGMHRRPAAVRTSDAFQSHLRGFVAIAEKDLSAALALGRECDVALPTATGALPLMARIYGVAD
jgi:3-hydroxyisobutyrate dehydrogenase